MVWFRKRLVRVSLGLTRPSAEHCSLGKSPNSTTAGKKAGPQSAMNALPRATEWRSQVHPGSRQRKREASALHPHSHLSREEHSRFGFAPAQLETRRGRRQSADPLAQVREYPSRAWGAFHALTI